MGVVDPKGNDEIEGALAALGKSHYSVKDLVTPVMLLALCWAAFQIYTVYGSVIDFIVAVPIHVMFGLAITFLVHPLRPKYQNRSATLHGLLDWAFIFCCGLIAVYYLLNSDWIIERVAGYDAIPPAVYALGLVAILLTLDATRRLIGNALTVIILLFIIFQYIGVYITGVPIIGQLGHNGALTLETLTSFIDIQLLQTQGLFGIPSIVSYTEVYYFLLFGAFLETFGAGKLFVNFATLLVGRFKGGMAKVAIIASTMFGSISGSATANASVMGMFTIPAMKRSKMSAVEAAAVEATASTGGQIMPPVMGAAAFLIAQFLGVPYKDIVIIAIIPALAYYVTLFFIVDQLAVKYNYTAIPKSEIKITWKDLARDAYLFIPVFWLVYRIIAGRALSSATLEATGICIALAFLEKVVRISRGQGSILTEIGNLIVDSIGSLASGSKAAIAVTVPCAAAGIIVGIAAVTNLGLTFGTFVTFVAGGFLLVAFVLIMILVIIMGMGMPTTAAYIMGVILGLPALTALGVPALPAHFFVLYFAVLSMVTPPVALASFVAAGIAHADIWRTGLAAFRNSIPGFLIAFAMVSMPAILLQGTVSEVVVAILWLLIGLYALSCAVAGIMISKLGAIERIVLALGSVGVVTGSGASWYQFVSAGIILAIFILRRFFIKSGDNYAINYEK